MLQNALKISLALTLFCHLCSFHCQAETQSSQHEILARIYGVTKRMVENKQNPVLLMDLDDTLIETRLRTLKIIEELSFQWSNQHPIEAEKLAQIHFMQVQYQLGATLGLVGIGDASLQAEAAGFWAARFFSNAYTAQDEEVRGAANFVRAIVEAGGKVVYLTGRDAPRMQAGTVLSLHRLGFPLDAAHAILKMKPNKELDDLTYKISAFEEVSKMGSVVAVFENEPKNLNAMKSRFPLAQAVFVMTIHSSATDAPEPTAVWIRNFNP